MSKSKKEELSKLKKWVRVDQKTVILVDVNIPSDVAIQNYKENIRRSFALTQRQGVNPTKKKEEEDRDFPDTKEDSYGEDED